MRPTPLLRAAAAALVVLAAPAPVAAQDAAALFGRLQEARRAADAGDHARAVALADTVAARLPDHPQVVSSRTLARAGRLARHRLNADRTAIVGGAPSDANTPNAVRRRRATWRATATSAPAAA
jgi:hypothetical protein